MTFTHCLRITLLGLALFGAASCSSDSTSSTVTAVSREIRGRVTTRRPPGRNITHVLAVDAKTRRTVASAAPDAAGNFVLLGVTRGRVYRLVMEFGRTAAPLLFPKLPGQMGKTNVFKLSPKACGRAQCDDAPIDLGELTDDGTDITPQDDMHSPLMYQDADEDGMPDALDPDVDGDGTPNTTDLDNDNNGIPDTGDPAAPQGMRTPGEYGDSDGDGITDEADPDADNDGIPNSMDTDDDGDGRPDAMELDTDNDGIPNAMDDDIDGDGEPNAEDNDANGDGDTDMMYRGDEDGDGIPDAMDDDVDGDGVPNTMDTDSDNDGIPNAMDMDDNNDGSGEEMPMG